MGGYISFESVCSWVLGTEIQGTSMRSVVDSFYSAINTGNNDLLWSLIHEKFSLVCPTREHVLSGVYQTKARFFDDVLPCVFGCVNPDNILFCAEHRILCASEDTVVALAMNKGEALTGKRYDQIYLHVFKCLDGQILTLIESFDTALANQALWGKTPALPADQNFTMASLDALGFSER